MLYYAERRNIKNDKLTVTTKNGERAEMQYQFHLFCANASKAESDGGFDWIEWGSVEQGALQHESFRHAPAPEPEPEPEE